MISGDRQIRRPANDTIHGVEYEGWFNRMVVYWSIIDCSDIHRNLLAINQTPLWEIRFKKFIHGILFGIDRCDDSSFDISTKDSDCPAVRFKALLVQTILLVRSISRINTNTISFRDGRHRTGDDDVFFMYVHKVNLSSARSGAEARNVLIHASC